MGKLISKVIVTFSNNTISGRIHHITLDLNDQLIEKMKFVEFGPQLDEVTDSNKDGQPYLLCMPPGL